ncbi:MAG: iron-sulfur cluster assembly scaffold protein [Candidatus Fermentibacteraceae bacterium]
MWKYSEVLMDHFMNPRNVGTLENPDGHSEVGSPQCGDAMNLDIEIDQDDRISEIKFRTFGCAGAIASASAMTELVKGLPLDDALKVKNSQIAEYLGGMPPEKYHCSVMGQQALKAAVKDFREKSSQVRQAVEEIISGFKGITVLKVHPRWILVRGESLETGRFQDMLAMKLGRQIELRKTAE